jgi:hypothetical protein
MNVATQCLCPTNCGHATAAECDLAQRDLSTRGTNSAGAASARSTVPIDLPSDDPLDSDGESGGNNIIDLTTSAIVHPASCPAVTPRTLRSHCSDDRLPRTTEETEMRDLALSSCIEGIERDNPMPALVADIHTHAARIVAWLRHPDTNIANDDVIQDPNDPSLTITRPGGASPVLVPLAHAGLRSLTQ